MTGDPASLDRLHDIIVPEAAHWWPLAPGWLWLLAALSIIVLWFGLSALARWQRNRYRREALAALAELSATGATTEVDKLHRMAEILKRTALTAYPRPAVAALNGPEWFDFLDRTGGTRFADGLGSALETTLYQGRSDCAAGDVQALAEQVRIWIRRHDRTGTRSA